MNRTYFFAGGLAALLLVVLAQSVGIGGQSAADTPSPSAAANPATAPAPVPDAVSLAIEDLAAWPIAANR